MSKSKLYSARLDKIDRSKAYSLEEALQVLKDLPAAKFDETVELAFRLGVDPRKSDQMIRGAMSLPKGTGKEVKVAVVASGEAATAAQEAGADAVGFEELIERIKGGWLEFDTLIATPAAMKNLRPLGRVLGPRGLMPNPKTGTVTDDPATAVREAKAGRVEYRTDRGACVHVPVGKRSFSVADLMENANTVIQAILRARPASTKGNYLLSLTVCSTMSPGIRIDTHSVTKA
ncbi:MAG: 50S ribosomal protein L1 [Lentisphaeria bacterium]|nr:50S ribosomal protein L1 [Lentisphaeria bacterium]